MEQNPQAESVADHEEAHWPHSNSSSTEITTQTHQRGGTLQGLVGSWVSKAVASGQDNTGLGQWSYIELQGCINKHYIILSGY